MARVTAEYQGAYRVKNQEGEYLAKITGKHMFNALSRDDYPAVGDWVAITDLGERNRPSYRRVLPRKTILKRKSSGRNETQIIATNIDTAFARSRRLIGDYSLNRFERYFAIARDGGIQPVDCFE